MVGLCKTIFNMTSAAPTKLLTELRNRFISLIDPNLSHDQEEVRNLSARVFLTVFEKTFEPNYMTHTLDKSILKKLHSYAVHDTADSHKQSDLLIEALKYMLKQAPESLKL